MKLRKSRLVLLAIVAGLALLVRSENSKLNNLKEDANEIASNIE